MELSYGASRVQGLNSQGSTAFPLLAQRPQVPSAATSISLHALTLPFHLFGSVVHVVMYLTAHWHSWRTTNLSSYSLEYVIGSGHLNGLFPRLYIFLLMQTFQRHKALTQITVVNRIMFRRVEEIIWEDFRPPFHYTTSLISNLSSALCVGNHNWMPFWYSLSRDKVMAHF